MTEIATIKPMRDALAPVLSEDATTFAKAALSENTRRTYRAQMALWVAYCEQNNLSPLPAYPTDVANWIAHRALNGSPHAARSKSGRSGQTVATLRTAVAAIATAHKLAGYPFESRHAAITQVLAGIRRSRPEAQRQVKAMRGAMVAEIIAGIEDTPRGRRDAALLALGYAFARRRSELTGLDWETHGHGDGWITVDDQDMIITLVRHKTQAGEPLRIIVPRAENPVVVRAIERWVAAAMIRAGSPLLRGIHKSGAIGDRLHPQSCATIIKRRVAAYLIKQGTDPQRAKHLASDYSGHSLRSGFTTTAAEAGADALAIASTTGHTSMQMVQRYTRQAQARKISPHKIKGVALG